MNQNDFNTRFNQTHALPGWTWFATALLLQAAFGISLLFKYAQGVSSFYIPTAVAIVLVHWWGVKRVIPIMYGIAILNTHFWGIENWLLWPLYSLPEVLGTWLSYFLFRKIIKGKYWLPSTRHFLLFTILGLLVPVTIELVLLQTIFTFTGQYTTDQFLSNFLNNWLGECTANFGIAIPMLYALTPVMHQYNLLENPPEKKLSDTRPKKLHQQLEILFVYVILFILSVITSFDQFWFAYGICSLYIAIRYGFREAIFCNLYVFIITYVLPIFYTDVSQQIFESESPLYSIYLGNILLSFFVALTGRVISDLRIAEKRLSEKNKELEDTNKELDRFVYSASHDLSAPLKSILGLVTISKMDPSPDASRLYLPEIEKSVLKLDAFISEILDYSRNKRSEIVPEQIHLRELCQEILENLKYLEGFNKIRFDLDSIQDQFFLQDKTRLRIILSNLISNAIKFQKRTSGHQPMISIMSERKNGMWNIRVMDNGEGIRPEHQNNVFNMFYRASENSRGSGLGLYIARESAIKIGGNIRVESEHKKGSVFTVEFPELT
ncbi:MAG: ATP-binding protein [Cyclobacteriaceae bacterium]|nr:ATP-binding protein [Cyclobacteriaceae bacterium]